MITYNPSYTKDFIDGLIGKAKAEEIKNLTIDEIHRVFDPCVSPRLCFNAFQNLVFNGLIMQDIYPIHQQMILFTEVL